MKLVRTDTTNDLAGEGTCQYRSHAIRYIQATLVLASHLMDKQTNEDMKNWKYLLRPLYTYFSRSLHMFIC